jgi:hypothetical protein
MSLFTTARADERAAHVVSVGTCWTGYNVVIVTMDNGDLLYLGDITQDIIKAQYAAALSAQASGQLVYYQIQAGTTGTVCSMTRGKAEWWIVGGSIF